MSRSNCGASRLSAAVAPGSRPWNISALASAIASIEPRYSRWTGAIVVTRATCGRTMRASGHDFARVIHADFEHGEAGARGHARKRQRHAPVIVVRSRRGVGRAEASEHRAQHLLHGRLADRAGHRDDARPRPRASGDAQPLHGLQRVLDRESGAETGEPACPLARDDGRRGAEIEGAGDVIVTVMRLALDGEEKIAGRKRAAVDRDAAGRLAHGRARRGAERSRQLGFSPQRRHRASASAARASSASENGSVLSPTIWPVS